MTHNLMQRLQLFHAIISYELARLRNGILPLCSLCMRVHLMDNGINVFVICLIYLIFILKCSM